jgi:cytochrome c
MDISKLVWCSINRRVLLATLVLFAQNSWSQGACDALPPASDFLAEKIADAPGTPYDIVVDKDLKVYWVERYGAFKVWDPNTKQIKLIKQFNVLATTYAGFTDVENGLEGLAFDLNFSTTHWIFVWYTLPVASGSVTKGVLGPYVRLARFTLKNNNTEVDMTSEKIIFQHQIFAQCCHFGGDLKMSKDGLLYLSTGDNIDYHYTGTGEVRAFDESIVNGDPRNTSSNTWDTRGKVLRIKPRPFPDTEAPVPGVGTTYDIPQGNLKDTWNTSEKDKVRPEIFSMGHRNPFTISVHPSKPWVAMGEANGDNPEEGDDEINLITAPGNFGWPFLIGDNALYLPSFWTSRTDAAKNPAAYTNQSKFNTGAKTMPPGMGSIFSVKHGKTNYPMICLGVTWGWVDYDSSSTSKAKWPPYLKGKLLVSSFGQAPLRVATIDAAGGVTKVEQLFPVSNFTTDILRATQGPDGAFYVGQGNGFAESDLYRIYKISYKGACSPVAMRAEAKATGGKVGQQYHIANLGQTEVAWPAGIMRMSAYNTQGKKVWEIARKTISESAPAILPTSISQGMLELKYSQH